MEQHTPAPGWYPDPATAGQRRFWDGQGWTNNTAPGTPRPATPGPRSAAPDSGGWQSGPPQQPFATPSTVSGASGRIEVPAGASADYYQRADEQFEAGGSNVVWNWAAFLFGALWYLYRGMWAKALLLAALVIISGGFLAIPVWIYGALWGTHDDYLLRRRGTQGW